MQEGERFNHESRSGSEKGGTARWTLASLMRQGPITLVGDMTLKRVSSQTELVLE